MRFIVTANFRFTQRDNHRAESSERHFSQIRRKSDTDFQTPMRRHLFHVEIRGSRRTISNFGFRLSDPLQLSRGLQITTNRSCNVTIVFNGKLISVSFKQFTDIALRHAQSQASDIGDPHKDFSRS